MYFSQQIPTQPIQVSYQRQTPKKQKCLICQCCIGTLSTIAGIAAGIAAGTAASYFFGVEVCKYEVLQCVNDFYNNTVVPYFN